MIYFPDLNIVTDIFSHNLFSVLANDFVYSNNNSFLKLLDTADKIGDDIGARIPSNLKGSPFHCPHYIKKLSHEKHTLYKKLEFSMRTSSETTVALTLFQARLDEFLALNKEYSDLCEKIIYIKKFIRRNHFDNYIVESIFFFFFLYTTIIIKYIIWLLL